MREHEEEGGALLSQRETWWRMSDVNTEHNMSHTSPAPAINYRKENITLTKTTDCKLGWISWQKASDLQDLDSLYGVLRQFCRDILQIWSPQIFANIDITIHQSDIKIHF